MGRIMRILFSLVFLNFLIAGMGMDFFRFMFFFFFLLVFFLSGYFMLSCFSKWSSFFFIILLACLINVGGMKEFLFLLVFINEFLISFIEVGGGLGSFFCNIFDFFLSSVCCRVFFMVFFLVILLDMFFLICFFCFLLFLGMGWMIIWYLFLGCGSFFKLESSFFFELDCFNLLLLCMFMFLLMWSLFFKGVFFGVILKNLFLEGVMLILGVMFLGVVEGVNKGFGVVMFFFLGVISEKFEGCNMGFFFLSSGVWDWVNFRWFFVFIKMAFRLFLGVFWGVRNGVIFCRGVWV